MSMSLRSALGGEGRLARSARAASPRPHRKPRKMKIRRRPKARPGFAALGSASRARKQERADTEHRHIGPGVRVQRMISGLAQTALSKAVGVTFQQVQKYEKGVNRVGASRLQQIANVLKVRPDFFFDGASRKAVGNSGSRETAIFDEFMSSR